MSQRKTSFIAAITAGAVLAALAFFGLGYMLGRGSSSAAPGGPDALSVVRDAYAQIKGNAVDPPAKSELTKGAVKGMLRVLKKQGGDRYATYYSPKSYRSVQELTSGRFSGIGVWLRKGDEGLRVDSVLPGSPAQAAGVRRGDVITRVDGTRVEGMSTDRAVSLIKGREGTSVRLGVIRSGKAIIFSITRASIKLPDVMDHMVGDNLGYIHLFQFAQGAGEQVRKEVEDLRSKGAEGIILDLRNNGGGLFSEGIAVANDFIEHGTVVRYKQRSHPEVAYRATGDAFQDVPLVVLVNGGTASASEIVAGALQDHQRAIVVGSQTYGKGSVQQVVPLPDSAAMKITTASYYTPNGRSINGVGVTPDVRVSDPEQQRASAIQILKGMVLSSTGSRG